MSPQPNQSEIAECDKEPENDSDYEEKDAPEPSKTRGKSRKRAAPKSKRDNRPAKRGNTGKLEAINKELPAEVVFLILSYLDPQTLISMSRTNKQFRETLLSSDLFWKVSRQGAGMPELEAKDITERQYLLLVFDKNCHGCSKPNVHHIDLSNCSRLCSACRNQTKVSPRQHQQLLASLHPMGQECAKHTKQSAMSFRCISRGIVKLSERLHQMDAAEVGRFVAERRLLKEQIARDACNILDWMWEQSKDKLKEEEMYKKAREHSIKKHLLALGWTDATLPKKWTYEPQVNQPRKLTPQIWKTIEAPLVKALRLSLIKSRNNLRNQAYTSHYRKLLQKDSQPDLFPSHNIFFTMPSVKPLWIKDQAPDPPAVELQEFVPFVEAEWLAALPAIRAAVAAYQREMIDLAVACLTRAYTFNHLPVPKSPVDDPRSYFRYTPPDRDHRGCALPTKDDEIILPFPAFHAAIRDARGCIEFKKIAQYHYNVVLKGV